MCFEGRSTLERDVMVIFQGSRRSDGNETLVLIVYIGWGPRTRNKSVDGLLETGKSFVDAFDLLLTSLSFSTGLDSLSVHKPEG